MPPVDSPEEQNTLVTRPRAPTNLPFETVVLQRRTPHVDNCVCDIPRLVPNRDRRSSTHHGRSRIPRLPIHVLAHVLTGEVLHRIWLESWMSRAWVIH